MNYTSKVKLSAMALMLIDHIGVVTDFLPFRLIGRLAMPLFVLLLLVGASRTKNMPKYCLRLFLWAGISQIPYTLLASYASGERSFLPLNILFTFMIVLLFANMFIFTEKKAQSPRDLLLYAVALATFVVGIQIGETRHFLEYGLQVFIIFSYYYFYKMKLEESGYFPLGVYTLPITYLYFCLGKQPYQLIALGCMLYASHKIIPTLLQDKQPLKEVDVLIHRISYVFYPLHMLLLVIITELIKNL